MNGITRVRVLGYIQRNAQLEREVSELKQQMEGVTRVHIMKHLNKNKQLEREISELKQQLLEAKQAVAARDETVKSLRSELAENTKADHTPVCSVGTYAKPEPSGNKVSAAKNKIPSRPDIHCNQVPAEKRNEQPKRPTKKAPIRRRFAELCNFFGAAPAAPKLAPGEKPLNPYQRENDPIVNKKIEQMLSNLPASEARRICHDRQFLGMKITQAKVQLFNQFKEYVAANEVAATRTPIHYSNLSLIFAPV